VYERARLQAPIRGNGLVYGIPRRAGKRKQQPNVAVLISPNDLDAILKGDHIRRGDRLHSPRKETNTFFSAGERIFVVLHLAPDLGETGQKLLCTARVAYWPGRRHFF
jgi:hypothetical protein